MLKLSYTNEKETQVLVSRRSPVHKEQSHCLNNDQQQNKHCQHSATLPKFCMLISQIQERQKCKAIMSLKVVW